MRQERLERQQAAAESARRKKLVGYVLAGVLALAAIGGVALAVTGGDDSSGVDTSYYPDAEIPARQVERLDDAVRAAGCELEDPRNEGADHVEGQVQYKSNPPASGNHNPIPAQDGIYTEAPPKENWVHTLEHGRIIVQFKPSVSPEVRGKLRALVEEDSYHMVLMPNNTRMEPEVAAIAWDHVLRCPRYNDRVPDAIRAFKEQYRDQGPENVP